jgi:arginine decarboxylase-like protein
LPDVLKNRLESLQSAFDYAVQSQGYEAHYQDVYPVKKRESDKDGLRGKSKIIAGVAQQKKGERERKK